MTKASKLTNAEILKIDGEIRRIREEGGDKFSDLVAMRAVLSARCQIERLTVANVRSAIKNAGFETSDFSERVLGRVAKDSNDDRLDRLETKIDLLIREFKAWSES